MKEIIVDSLVKPFIQTRNLSGLKSDTIRKMEVVLDCSFKHIVKDKSHPFPGKTETKSRCHLCEKVCEGKRFKLKKKVTYAISIRVICHVENIHVLNILSKNVFRALNKTNLFVM